MLDTAFPPWPSFSAEEVDAVARVVQSGRVNYWTGNEGRAFEKEFAEWTGSAHAVALANGTVALDVALRAVGIGARHEVVVTPRSFLASASSIVNAGAIPIFADVDESSQNITAATVAEVLTPRTKAILCVHLAGWPCEMDAIMQLARDHDLFVIEDCAQAHGARYQGRSVGGFGHVGAWSFCQDKIMTTGGEGGMVTTDDERLWSHMWSYKDHGKSYDAVYHGTHGPGFRWVHESFGTNWRMLEMQATIGRLQLQKMSEWHRCRAAHANRLAETLRDVPALRTPLPPAGVEHAWYKFYSFLRPEMLKADWNRDRILGEIHEAGIPCGVGSCSEMYLEKAFDNTGLRPARRLPIAQRLGETSLMFLVHPTLGVREIDRTGEVVSRVVRAATR